MIPVPKYNGGLTAEQFLFHEIRVAVKFYLEGKPLKEATQLIKQDNLFQYPTERQIPRLAKACYSRLEALNNKKLVEVIAQGRLEAAKQINLYAMMRYNRVVRDFMCLVIGEKFRTQDFAFPRSDLNLFFTRLREQNENVAAWSTQTVERIKSVLVRCLFETEYLDSVKSQILNRVLICEELEQGIRENGDWEALAAFNCFR